MLGVFSAPDKVERRNLIRNETKGDWPKELVEFKFIFGRPATLELARMLSKEQEEHGDIVIVGCEENIDTGEFYERLWDGEEMGEGEGGGSRRARLPPPFFCLSLVWRREAYSYPLLFLLVHR